MPDIDDQILRVALLLRGELCRVAAQTNKLGAMANDNAKLEAAGGLLELAADFADKAEYLMAKFDV